MPLNIFKDGRLCGIDQPPGRVLQRMLALARNPLGQSGDFLRRRAVRLLVGADLEATFPTTRDEMAADLPPVANLLDLASGRTPEVDLDAPATRVVRLEDHEALLREVLCTLQGVKRPG